MVGCMPSMHLLQGNSVVAALAHVFAEFQRREQQRSGQAEASLEPLLAVDPSVLREALAEVSGQQLGAPLPLSVGSCRQQPSVSSLKDRDILRQPVGFLCLAGCSST